MTEPHGKIVVVMPAYFAAETLASTLGEIPPELQCEILVVDDHSGDHTVEVAKRLGLQVIEHPQNRGYGGNQKTCYQSALDMGADIICMLHPDHQYDAKTLPSLIECLINNEADICLGSRFYGKKASHPGMHQWRRLGNNLLTHLQNQKLGLNLTEYHTGLRAYRRNALLSLDFDKFDNAFLFDQQLLIDAAHKGLRIAEVPTTGRYFPGVSSISLRASIVYGLRTLHYLWTS